MSSHSAMDLIDRLSGLSKEITDTLQDSFFESLAYGKRERTEAKVRATDFSTLTTVYLGHHLKHAAPIVPGRRYVNLSEDFLQAPPSDIPPGSVFLLLNNDIGPALAHYVDFYQAHPEVLFIVWDWDAQHWIKMSSLLAMNCDFYVSATSENAFLLSHFNPCVLGPVFAGVHQWSRRFLYENFGLLTGPRSETPFGPHVLYEKYPKRNRMVATLAQHYDSVRFTDNQYKAKTDTDNLVEWASHRSHWIVPVLGGVPIRVYNALITGGIPIVPSFYRNLPEVASLGAHILFYDVNDVVAPQAINELANERFSSQGGGGLIQRISEAMAEHHIDTRCEQILQAAEQASLMMMSGRSALMPRQYRAMSA